MVKNNPASPRPKKVEKKDDKKDEKKNKPEDYIYFVMSGEFAATQIQKIVNQGMDRHEFEFKNNKDYMQVQKECFLK